MGLADAVEDVGSEGASHVPVDGAEGSALEVPLALAVVGQFRVGVLEVGDHDEVVVDDEVGDEVVLDDFGRSAAHAPEGEGGDGDADAEVRHEDLSKVTLVKDWRGRVEVCEVAARQVQAQSVPCSAQGTRASTLTVGPSAVVLSGSVPEEVHGPADGLLKNDVDEVPDGGVLKQLVHGFEEGLLLVLALDLGLDLDGVGLGCESKVGSRLGNKDLVPLHGAGGSVVPGVGDPPAVVRYEEGRVEDPADGVVDGL